MQQMTYPEPRLTIREIMHARSVAVIGASEDESKWGGRALAILRRHTVSSEVYPVNPKASELMGLPAYKSIADCPRPVDIAMVLVPQAMILDTLEQCAKAGVGCAIVITSGFAEVGGDGHEIEARMREIARSGGMRVIGPNCIGILNAYSNMLASTAVALVEIDRAPGGTIGFTSQSGALMGSMLARGFDVGAGFSSLISLGNQCDIDINETFEYLIEDPQTRTICLYVEALRGPATFRSLLARAREAGKPVLVCKSGRSEAGEKAIQSHTASMTGAYATFEAVCRAEGAFLFENVSDMLDAAMLLSHGARLIKPSIAVFSGSGGAGALLVDALSAQGFTIAELTESTKASLRRVLPESNLQSPIDFGTLKPMGDAHPLYEDPFEYALGETMADENVGAGIVLLTSQPTMHKVAYATQKVGRKTDKPLLYVHVAGSIGDSARQVMREQGYGFVESQNDALKVFDALWQQTRMPSGVTATPVTFELPRLAGGFLSEPDARRMLEAASIPTTPWVMLKEIEEVVEHVERQGGAWVIKAVSPTLIHKSDIGAVKLNIQDGHSARQACREIAQALGSAQHSLDGYLVTRMVKADAELILGIKRDPDFGPMVVIGAGGTLVELLHDVQMMPAPVHAVQALAMIEQLKCFPLLKGWRGSRPADLAALAELIVATSQLACQDEALEEMDINPLMLVDGQFMAADARAFRRS
ncbi:acetate--CoA ligase family protein [Orrella marina]|uniref:CoA-binding domain-containing protein n=1 Tax=Orrella marina TaxID=2163011 RepID=A0A2R4XNT0_9BURK|nr:acetate--CoA ligase family protein [Orrella marina]AWB35428.1 hypothetical protein DBV39_18655 [Orrella marina]